MGQLNNYVPCSFVLDDDTTFLRKYAATLEASACRSRVQTDLSAKDSKVKSSSAKDSKPF